MKKSTKTAKKAAPPPVSGENEGDGGSLGNVGSRIKAVEEKVQYLFNNAKADVYHIRKELVKEIIQAMKEEVAKVNENYSLHGKELIDMNRTVEQDRNMLKEMQRELPVLKQKINELRENIQYFSKNNEADEEKPSRKRRK